MSTAMSDYVENNKKTEVGEVIVGHSLNFEEGIWTASYRYCGSI